MRVCVEVVERAVMRVDYATLFRAPALNGLYRAQVSEQAFQEVDPCGLAPARTTTNTAANGVLEAAMSSRPARTCATPAAMQN